MDPNQPGCHGFYLDAKTGTAECRSIESPIAERNLSRDIGMTQMVDAGSGFMSFDITYVNNYPDPGPNGGSFNPCTTPVSGLKTIPELISEYLISFSQDDLGNLCGDGVTIPMTITFETKFGDEEIMATSGVLGFAGPSGFPIVSIPTVTWMNLPTPTVKFQDVETPSLPEVDVDNVLLPRSLARLYQEGGPPGSNDINITLFVKWIDPLVVPIYNYSNSYTVGSNSAFKGLFIHELMHGLGFLGFFFEVPGIGGFASPFDMIRFDDSDLPTTSVEFAQTNRTRQGDSDRSSLPDLGTNNKMSDGMFTTTCFMAPDGSHLAPDGGNNGLMEPFLVQGGNALNLTNDMGPLRAMGYNNAECICVRGDTLLALNDGKETEKRIDQIKPGDVVQDFHTGEDVVVIDVAVSGSAKKYFILEANHLGPGAPNRNLYLTNGHPVWSEFHGGRIDCNKVPDVKTHHLDQVEAVYSLITQDTVFVKMNNAGVCTWSKENFGKFFHGTMGKSMNLQTIGKTFN